MADEQIVAQMIDLGFAREESTLALTISKNQIE